jgi:PadR family transcriptional regulator PadR
VYEADRVPANLRKGVTEFCVLALLRHGPEYGLELANVLEREGLAAGPSTLYPMLSRLHAAGMVVSEWRETDSSRRRRYYALTDAGHRELKRFQSSWTSLRNTVDRILKEKPDEQGT